MKQSFLILALLLPFCLLSQEVVDSTSNLIKNEKYSEAIAYAKEQSSRIKGDFTKARLLQLMADAYYYINDIPTSLSYYLRSGEAYHKIQDMSLLYHEVIGHTGFCYRELGELDNALIYYKKALNMAYAIGEESEIASDHANLGTVYARIGNLEEANSNFLKAYSIDISRKDTSAIGFDLRNLAEMQMLIGDYYKAKEHLEESIELLSNSSGNANSLPLRLRALGNAYVAMKVYDSAKFYLENSTDQLIALGDTLNTIGNWLSLARLDFKLQKFNNSLTYTNRALEYISKNKMDNVYLLEAEELLANIYIETGKLDQAKSLVLKNIEIANRLDLLSSLRNGYYQLASIEEKQANYLSALKAHKKFKQLNDSILNSESKKNIQELSVLYKVDQLDQKNEILQLENEVAKAEAENKASQFRWTLIASLLIIVGIIAVSWAYNSRQKYKNRLLIAEVDQLRNQIKLAVEGDSNAITLELATVNEQLHTPLTEREFEILNYAITDISNSEIAEKAFVSVNTVKYHLKNIYEKLGVSNKKEALQFALRAK